MTEDPIKLFASRAERLPRPDDSQTLREAIEKGIEQIPVAGPITTFITTRFWAPSASRRLEEWLREFAEDFDRHCKDCKVENLVKDQAFISGSIQVARIVIATHQEEKRKFLRNALLNIALGKSRDELRQQIFLNAIEAFSPAHVRTLDLLWRGAGTKIVWDRLNVPIYQRTYFAAIQVVAPELRNAPEIIQAVLADLRNRGFSNLGTDTTFPQGPMATNLGIEFLQFVRSPDDLGTGQI